MNQTTLAEFPFHEFDSPIPSEPHHLSYSSHSSPTSLPSPPGYPTAHGAAHGFHSPIVSPSPINQQEQKTSQSQLNSQSPNIQQQQILNVHSGQPHSRFSFQSQSGSSGSSGSNDISRININFLEFRIRKLIVGSYCEHGSERMAQMRFRFRFTQRGVSLYLANGAREVGLALASVEDFTLANHKVTMTLRPGAKKRFRRRIGSDFFVDINEDVTGGNIEKSPHVVMFATEDTDLSLLQLIQLGILHYIGKVGPVVQANNLNGTVSPSTPTSHLMHTQATQFHLPKLLTSSSDMMVGEHQLALALGKMSMKQPAKSKLYVKLHYFGQTRILMLAIDASFSDMTMTFQQRFGLGTNTNCPSDGSFRFECQCEDEFFGKVRLDGEEDWQVAKQLAPDGRMEIWCNVAEE